MLSLAPIQSYKELVDAQLLEQYKESTNFRALLDLLMAPFTAAEEGLQELMTLLNIDTAEGAQLDILGRIANEPRAGRSDVDYRAILKVWFTSKQSGTPEDILRTIRELTGLPGPFQYIPEYPAGFFIFAPSVGSLTQDTINKISPAGVQGYIGCILVDTQWDPIVTATGDYILLVGPCDFGPVSAEDGSTLLTETGETINLENI